MFIQVHENEEYQAVSLAKKSQRVLYFIHTRDTNNNKHQQNSNMPWCYCKFPCLPVADERYKMIGRNNILHIIITG